MKIADKNMVLESQDITAHKLIPKRFTGEGDNISPGFTIKQVPEGTRSFALLCHDPDAPVVKATGYGFMHWMLYNIPANIRTIEAGTKAYTQGLNDFGTLDYGGPMPPKGHGTHYYYYVLFALDENINLQEGLAEEIFFNKIAPHVIGMARLVGVYKR